MCDHVYDSLWCPVIPSTSIARYHVLLKNLDGTGILEQGVQAALLGLQIGVSANVLLCDEDVGHGGLARHFAEGALNRGAVI
jgi:hypothetical protein